MSGNANSIKKTPDIIMLSDASKDASLEFLKSQIDIPDAAKSEVSKIIDDIGGRLSDLKGFIGKVRSGMGITGTLSS